MPKRNGGKRRSGSKKYGREKKKKAAQGTPMSAFVRGRIPASEYWRLAKITAPRKRG